MPAHGADEDWRMARRLVLAHGWNSTAYQILNPGMELWFDLRREAVVGFVTRAGVRVAAGAPVCDRGHLVRAAVEFEADARALGERVCWFGAESRLRLSLRAPQERALLPLGAQPVWDPQEWPARTGGVASLRAQLHRARNKGVTVAERTGGGDDLELRECLREWLAGRGLPPLHFLTESRTLANLVDRRLFVARAGGEMVGFVVASPVPARNGWLLEQVVRRPRAPNGTAELMIDRAVRELAESGATYVTLGLAPLALAGQVGLGARPWWLQALLSWARAHGRRFYDFRGLEFFKNKFRPPRWDPIYAIDWGPSPSPRTVYAIAAAFSDGPPAAMLARAIGSAARKEVGALLGARRSP